MIKLWIMRFYFIFLSFFLTQSLLNDFNVFHKNILMMKVKYIVINVLVEVTKSLPTVSTYL